MSHSGSIHVFVLIDALGWPLVEETGFLADLLPYRQPLRTILGYSSGAIPSLLTGRPPFEHGHWNLLFYDPTGSPFRWLRHLFFLPARMLDNRLTRKLLKELGRRILGLGPLFECYVPPRLLPWFNWVEKRNIYAPGGVPGTPTIFDRLMEADVPHRVYSYHQWSDAKILLRAREDIERGDARMFFLYLSELDAFLHHHRPEPYAWAERLAWYQGQLAQVFDAALKVDSAATLIVCSDHGMAPVRSYCDIGRELGALGFAMPRDYLAVYDSTMARFWFFSERAQQGIMERLESLSCGRIVPDNELRALGILFPDRRYGEVVFLLNPGLVVDNSGFNGGGWRPAGMHGYHPDDPESDAVFLSNRQPPIHLRTILDIHPLLVDAARGAVS
jgi:predicted AlkP superfamily pyrophosphatase or phosphodiesterase